MKVYMTRHNSDMIEGKGGMVNDLCFLYREHAAEYIDTKEGVWGFKRQWSIEPGDWDIHEIDVIDYSVVALAKTKEELRLRAMAKLTSDEIDALGLKDT